MSYYYLPSASVPGFSFDVPASTPGVEIALPGLLGQSDEDRVWGIHLAAWHGSVGLTLVRARAKIEWGGGGVGGSGQETAVIDYPASGTSVSVAGNIVRVAVLALPSSIPITVGGWLTQGVSGANHQMEATLTDDPIALASGATFSFHRPARARAYRVLRTGALPVAFDIQASQSGEDGGIESVDFPELSTDAASRSPTNRAQWLPLAPRTSDVALSVTYAPPDVPQLFRVQWLLELI